MLVLPLKNMRRMLRANAPLLGVTSRFFPGSGVNSTASRNTVTRLLCTGKNIDNDKKEVTNVDAAKNVAPGGSTPASSRAASHPESIKPTPGVNGKVEARKPDIASNLGTNIASTLHFTQQKYEELEKSLMASVHYKHQQRFRAMFIGTIMLIAWISIVFGTRLRKYFTEQTAGLAKETLENKELKIQTQELATAVVQTILENKEIASHAAAFLKEASTVPETQQALLKLTLHILQHKETLEELTKLSQRLIKDLANDKDTIAELARLLEKVLEDQDLRNALIVLVGQLCQDKEVLASVMGLVVKLAGEPHVTEATSKLLTGTVSDVMQDEDISLQSRHFIAEVVGDDLLQKEGGHALWQSIKYALEPGIIRVTGVTLVVVSVAFAKLMLSPY